MGSLEKKILEYFGSIKKVSDFLGVAPAYTWQMLHGVRPWQPKHCRAIESAMAGQVTRYELRPDVFGPAPDKRSAA